jgi:hypothetical protein
MFAIPSFIFRSVGLETLFDVPLPKHLIDENSMLGKAVNSNKPDSAQARCSGCSAPLEIAGWDILGPCKSAFFGQHQYSEYCAVFADHFLGTVGFTCSKIRVRCLNL